MTLGLVRIIVNPISGRGQDRHFLGELERHLTLRGFAVDAVKTEHAGHASALAAATPDDAHCVVSVGGDGSHRDVLAGLTGRPVPVAIVPSGTENVLGRTLGLMGTLHETVELIHHGRPVGLDVGEANGRRFVLFSGIGFDAAITQEVNRIRTEPLHRSAYYGPVVRMWWRYGFPPITVKVDGRLLADDAGMAFVANTPLYGDRLRIAPRARGDDGLLDVVCFRARSRWQALAHFVRAKMGRHLEHPLVAFSQGRTIEVSCPSRELPVQIDGDAVLTTPVTYHVIPKAVTLLVPRSGTAHND